MSRSDVIREYAGCRQIVLGVRQNVLGMSSDSARDEANRTPGLD